MARIEWVRLRLNNWALWKARESSGGLGFKTQCTYLNVVVDGGHRESTLPVDDVDAEVTNQAVLSLRGPRQHLYDTLVCIYLQDTGHVRGALKLGCAVSTVKARLEEADRALR